MLKGKKILLGVCGSIAAYKIPELVRLYRKSGAEVTVLMTENACRFVTPLTLRTLSRGKVITDLFEEDGVAHIDAVGSADVMVVAPATANMLGKMAWGLADDAVSTALLAAGKPVLVAPAMNSAMWGNSLVKRNAKILEKAGYLLIRPESGDLACGQTGPGRLADTKKILWETARLIMPADFKGRKVLITAGPTREYADPVRFMSNASSGKTGYALAIEAYCRGADVTLVTGAEQVPVPDGVKIVKAVTAGQMHKAVMARVRSCDIFIANAAVGDYRFAVTSPEKIAKRGGRLRPEMVLTRDILADAAKAAKHAYIVGFALESSGGIERALAKMRKKGCDMMILNGVGALGSDESEIVLITGEKTERFMKLPKVNVARTVFDAIVKFI